MKNLQILFAKPGTDEISYGLFSKGNSKYIAGNAMVEQLVAKILLTDPGTNLFSPSLGGGLQEFMKRTVGRENLRTRIGEIAQMLTKVEIQIRASQAGEDLLAAERLRSLELDFADFNFTEGLWTINIRVLCDDDNEGRVLIGP